MQGDICVGAHVSCSHRRQLAEKRARWTRQALPALSVGSRDAEQAVELPVYCASCYWHLLLYGHHDPTEDLAVVHFVYYRSSLQGYWMSKPNEYCSLRRTLKSGQIVWKGGNCHCTSSSEASGSLSHMSWCGKRLLKCTMCNVSTSGGSNCMRWYEWTTGGLFCTRNVLSTLSTVLAAARSRHISISRMLDATYSVVSQLGRWKGGILIS